MSSKQVKEDVTRVWLLLFDLHMRHFQQRDPEETLRKVKLFKEADLLGEWVLDGRKLFLLNSSIVLLQPLTNACGTIG